MALSTLPSQLHHVLTMRSIDHHHHPNTHHHRLAGAPEPQLRHCVVQAAPGDAELHAQLLSQLHSGAAAAAVEAADALYRDGAPSWLLEAALLALWAAAEEGPGDGPCAPGQSWVRVCVCAEKQIMHNLSPARAMATWSKTSMSTIKTRTALRAPPFFPPGVGSEG